MSTQMHSPTPATAASQTGDSAAVIVQAPGYLISPHVSPQNKWTLKIRGLTLRIAADNGILTAVPTTLPGAGKWEFSSAELKTHLSSEIALLSTPTSVPTMITAFSERNGSFSGLCQQIVSSKSGIIALTSKTNLNEEGVLSLDSINLDLTTADVDKGQIIHMNYQIGYDIEPKGEIEIKTRGSCDKYIHLQDSNAVGLIATYSRIGKVENDPKSFREVVESRNSPSAVIENLIAFFRNPDQFGSDNILVKLGIPIVNI